MKLLSLLLICYHALRYPVPRAYSHIVGVNLKAGYAVVSLACGLEDVYVTFDPGTRRYQVEEWTRQACQELESLCRPTIDLGPIEFRVPASRKIDCGGDA